MGEAPVRLVVADPGYASPALLVLMAATVASAPAWNAAEMAARGYLNECGKPFNPKSVSVLLAS
jgi:hypothetical protein